jgi:signal transduction histidine kinase/HPt (histidine-containing phosphotransfer) domain-containing protein
MLRESTAREGQARAVFAGRIDILYSLGRHYLSLPFAVLSMIATLFAERAPTALIFVPLFFQILVVIAAEQLSTAYKHRAPESDPEYWAKRYTFVSGIAGATWGIGAWFWFMPHAFAAQAYLTLAFLGMTATEFIARSAYRPAYLAHTAFALTPLVLLLLHEGGLYQIMSALLVVLFAAVLANYADSMARLLDDSIRLSHDNRMLLADIRLQKEAAEAARDEARTSTHAKSLFIANISHELRTPLNALLGMTQILERAELDNPHREHVKVMLEAGYGLKTLLDDVLTLTIDDERPSEEECDPAQAARAVARLAQPRAWEKQLRLNVAAIAGVPHVAADPRRVRQILLKLVDNALKFTDRGGVEIRVESETSGGAPRVRLTVADTGQGVPPEIASKLFKPFSPGDPSYSRMQQGAGLGLAVAKRIVDLLHGEIGFESEPGSGAAFWFTLPVSHSKAASEERAEGPAPSGLSLLVFAPQAEEQLTALLAPFGNAIHKARDAVDAISRASREHFDAIVVDASHTDMVAAAPGVKAPILSIVPAGEREPAGAHEIMRWPGPPGELYAALATLKGRTPEADAKKTAETKAKPAPLDAKAISALEKSVGTKTLIEILQAYIHTAEQLCNSLTLASERANWDEAARFAQDIAGSAGALGLSAVTDAARAFATGTREGVGTHELRNRAQTVLWEHDQVCRALESLYPDLAA